MRRYWWTVWIKVAVLAIVLLIGFFAAKKYVRGFFEPYLIEEEDTVEEEPEVAEDSDPVKAIFGKVQDKLGFRFRYEDMIFDYANGFAKDMMEDSEAERNAISEPLS
ncbi:MAG: hypothetical protein IJJ99_03770 [Oscillospiraceae bacterium]|nr:hypothetical protein [Oscillospiraceae bacterium]